MSLQTKLELIIKEESGTYGVAVKHLQTGEQAAINENQLFQLASTFKVPILTTLFRDVEDGKLRLDQRIRLNWEERVPGSGVLQELDAGVEVTVKDLAMLMIIVSDNFATDKILQLIGIENVNQYMKQLGLTDTFIQNSCWRLLSLCVGIDEPNPTADGFILFNQLCDEGKFNNEASIFEASRENNVSTPKEMNRLLEMIARKELISHQACDGMIDILLRQQLRNRIPYLLPNNTKTATKSGTIGGTVNDVGIVYMPEEKGAFIISVLSSGVPSKVDGERTIARLSRTVYDYFMEA